MLDELQQEQENKQKEKEQENKQKEEAKEEHNDANEQDNNDANEQDKQQDKKEKVLMQLQLGDVIRFHDPTNIELNDSPYFINYRRVGNDFPRVHR